MDREHSTMREWSVAEMSERLVRFDDLRPCTNAFVDTRTPGSDKKENFTIIGPGVAENPHQYVHIREAHGFNIGAARQPPGCLNSQHSHDTAEVFFVHEGRWRMMWGVNADEGEVILEEGDTISIPVQMFRGFENVGTGPGFLFAVLGGDDPGRVTWAPSVFDLAAQYGLVLLSDGRLVDTTLGEEVPQNSEREKPPSPAEIARLAVPKTDRMNACVARADALVPNFASAFSQQGVAEAGVITPRATADGFVPGPIEGWWPHGFNLRRLSLHAGKATGAHSRAEAEVLIVHRGNIRFAWPGGEVVMHRGDVLTVPIGLRRDYVACEDDTVVFVVRGGESPQPPEIAQSLESHA